jgi:hypothetical protein
MQPYKTVSLLSTVAKRNGSFRQKVVVFFYYTSFDFYFFILHCSFGIKVLLEYPYQIQEPQAFSNRRPTVLISGKCIDRLCFLLRIPGERDRILSEDSALF